MNSNTLILGIESSCDDTSVALMRNNELLDCIVVSSSEFHKKYGGIVPELAAREHERLFLPIIKELFDRTGVYWREVTHIAYTDTPGLAGCLLVGKIFAKTLALIHNKPLIPVNHVFGHIFSVNLTSKNLKFPFLALVVSGKTTAIYYVSDVDSIEVLDETMDNALGEVYDKVARELGLSYPGGAKIDNLFNKDRDVEKLLANKTNPAQKFSYSGVLSAVCRLWKSLESLNMENKQEYIATVFQKWVIDGLIDKVKYWSVKKNVKNLSVSGGVASNKYLREQIERLNMSSFIVDSRFSGDNAAMIANYAFNLIVKSNCK